MQIINELYELVIKLGILPVNVLIRSKPPMKSFKYRAVKYANHVNKIFESMQLTCSIIQD